MPFVRVRVQFGQKINRNFRIKRDKHQGGKVKEKKEVKMDKFGFMVAYFLNACTKSNSQIVNVKLTSKRKCHVIFIISKIAKFLSTKSQLKYNKHKAYSVS